MDYYVRFFGSPHIPEYKRGSITNSLYTINRALAEWGYFVFTNFDRYGNIICVAYYTTRLKVRARRERDISGGSDMAV